MADFVSRLASELHAAGESVTVLTSNPAADGNQPYRVKILTGNWNWHHRRRVRSWIASERFDVVDIQYETNAYGLRIGPILLPYVLSRLPTTLVLTLHSEGLPRRGGRAWRLIQFRPYDSVVFYSRPLLERMTLRFPGQSARFEFRGFPSNIVPVVSPWLAPLVGRLKGGWHTSETLLTYFGHISSNRGIEDLISAVLMLRKNGMPVQLAVASAFDPAQNPYHRSLLVMVRDLGLTDQISFPGQLPAEGISQLLQASDLAVLPFPDGASFKNGSLAAALVHGLPIVTTKSELTERELAESPAIAFCKAGDVTGLAATVGDVLRDKPKRMAMASAARELALFFSWKEYVTHRLSVYRIAESRTTGKDG